MAIARGATSSNVFTVPIDFREVEVMYITYCQRDKTVLEKEITDCDITEEKITVELSQEDSLLFEESVPVEIQIRARFSDSRGAVVSDIVTTGTSKLLKEGVI